MVKLQKHEKVYVRVGIFLLLFWTFFSYVNANHQSFWIDELSTIGFVSEGISLWDMLDIYLKSETNLPLYSIFFYFFYRIMPFGDVYLLIPSVFFACFGIVMLAKCMYLITENIRDGFIVLFLGCSSSTLIWQGVWEIRCYSLLFFLSILSLYYFIKCYKKPCKQNYIRYSLSIFLFIWTHWFAGLVLFIYGLADLFLLLKKKNTLAKILSYLPAIITILPWFIISFINKQTEISNFWTSVPEWKNMLWTILFYLNGRKLLFYIFLIAAFSVCIKLIAHLYKRDIFDCYKNYVWFLILITIVGTIVVVFIYSYFINPNGSMYVERYFMVIAPHILLLTTYAFVEILHEGETLSTKYKNGKKINSVIKITLLCILIHSFCMCYRDSYISIRKPFEEYETAAEILIRDGNIWNEDCLLIGSNKACALNGFIDYYFKKQGYPIPTNILDCGIHNLLERKLLNHYSELSEKEFLQYNKIYMLRIHMGYDEGLLEFIEEHYHLSHTSWADYGIEVWEK